MNLLQREVGWNFNPFRFQYREGESDELFLGTNERAKAFGEKRGIERLAEGLVDAGAVEAGAAAVVGKKRDEDDLAEFRVAAEILADLDGFRTTNREVDDDAVRVEAFRLDAGVKAAGGDGDAEGLFSGQFALDVFDEDLVLSDDQNLGLGFVFKFAERHIMFFEELDQAIARNAAVLGTRDTVSLKATGIKPLADGARRNLADLGDLTSCKNLHFGLSDKKYAVVPTKFQT